MYVNYEVLCNAFATKIIDLSKAEIVLVKSSEISPTEFEDFLIAQNQYTFQKFYERFEKIEKLKNLEAELKEKKEQKYLERQIIINRQNKYH